jgi:hypothetical protein
MSALGTVSTMSLAAISDMLANLLALQGAS